MTITYQTAEERAELRLHQEYKFPQFFRLRERMFDLTDEEVVQLYDDLNDLVRSNDPLRMREALTSLRDRLQMDNDDLV